MNLANVLQNPSAYLNALKFSIAGLYFDWVMKQFRVDGLSFHVPTALTTRRGRGYFALNLYEDIERTFIARYINGSEAVLELGACIGVVSCLVNSRLRDRQRHVVVEANPELIPHLTRNRDRNSCRFSIVSGAVSEKNELAFYFGDSIVSGSLVTPPPSAAQKKTSVRGRRLHDLETEFGIRFDTLVIDIEGGEYDFFLENESALAGFNLIILENHPHILSADQIAGYENILTRSGLSKSESLSTSSVWKRV